MQPATEPMQSMAAIADRILAIAASQLRSSSDVAPYECDQCSDTDWFVIPGVGAMPCPCVARRKSRLKAEQRSRLLEQVPAEYRDFRLDTAKPMESRHAKQAAILAAIQADPTASLFLSGRHGTGKSFLTWLMFRRAVEESRPAVCLTLTALLKQFREWEFDESKTPVVTPEMLRRPGVRWFIGIDEMEKARPSEFAAEKLADLMDAVYANRHQLAVTSNLNASALREHWSREQTRPRTNGAHPDAIYDGSVYGGSIIRRIVELHGLIQVEMF